MLHWLTEAVDKMVNIMHNKTWPGDPESQHVDADAILVDTIRQMAERLDYHEGGEWWQKNADLLTHAYEGIEPMWYA